jgi:molybdenum cofactor cytidylyltransferase
MAIGVIILAAGGSSRMGRPKQLLPYRGDSLIRFAAKAALESVCDRVVVVIGSQADEIRRELDDLSLSVVENQSWQKGMSSSIHAGLQHLLSGDHVESVVIMLCDQPFVTADVLNELVNTHRETSKPIVASTYGTTRGVPALFSRELFAELTSLTADQGARRIIATHPEDVVTITFPQGAVDIDTPHDHERLVR